MLKVRYYDIIEKSQNNAEKKSGDEIVKDIVTRAGLEIR